MAKSYFSHDSNAKDDPKIIKLIDALGLEGYGAFWVLIELLREQPNLRLPIASIPRICRTFGITTPKMESVIYHFELFSNDGEYFFSPSLLKRMLEMKEKYTARTVEGWKTRLQNADNQQNFPAIALQSIANYPQTDADAMQNDAENANKIKLNKTINISFDDFWKLYDKSAGKQKSEKKWNSLKNEERELIMQHLPKYKLSRPDKTFRKDPLTYLNNKSWEDEIIGVGAVSKAEPEFKDQAVGHEDFWLSHLKNN